MLLSLKKRDLENIIYKATGIYPDELALLNALSGLCDAQDIKNSKILFLVGCSREFKVAGVSFGERQDVLTRLDTGDVLNFIPEPTNKHDLNAIQVFFNEEIIGYLPKKQALLIQDCIEELCGEVTNIIGGEEIGDEPTHLGIRFKFRRKENINKKQIINLDAIIFLLEDCIGTPQELIAKAQMMDILTMDNEKKNAQEKRKTENIEQIPNKEKVILSKKDKKNKKTATEEKVF